MSGKGDKWRKTDFKKYWESDFWKSTEAKLKNINKETDMLDTKCNCGGTFIEMYFHDDMDGVLHCDKCEKEILRYQRLQNVK